MAGKCPSCGNAVLTLRGNGVDVTFLGGESWKAVTYNCPSCNVVLGCQIDPIAVKSDTVSETVNRLKKS